MSRSYYNEFNKESAAWLRELIKEGHIADGDVDERSIEDVLPSELAGYTQCHFFAGIGVWSYALRQAGWSDDRPVWTGSCPCQPFSQAGKGTAFADERHLWPSFFHLIKECRPEFVFGEQVASKNAGAWVDLVQDDMEGLDYAFGAVAFPAAGIGAKTIRNRCYWMANSVRNGRNNTERRRKVSESKISSGVLEPKGCFTETIYCRDGKARQVEPGFTPWVDGTPEVLVRLRGYGNAIHAGAAKVFIETVMEIAA